MKIKLILDSNVWRKLFSNNKFDGPKNKINCSTLVVSIVSYPSSIPLGWCIAKIWFWARKYFCVEILWQYWPLPGRTCRLNHLIALLQPLMALISPRCYSMMQYYALMSNCCHLYRHPCSRFVTLWFWIPVPFQPTHFLDVFCDRLGTIFPKISFAQNMARQPVHLGSMHFCSNIFWILLSFVGFS